MANKKIINLQVVFNKILHRIWNLPFNFHTKIVHCVSRIESIDWIRLVRHNFGNYSDIEDFVHTVSAV